MFSLFGRSVPSLKINLISCCLRLMLLPAHCFKPQTMMSSREWEAELKCSITGNPRDRFRILRRCSLKRSRSRLPVSPMHRQLQRRQEMQYTTFSDWQVKWSRMLCALFGPCREVWGVMCETSVISLYTPLMPRRLSLMPVHCPADDARHYIFNSFIAKQWMSFCGYGQNGVSRNLRRRMWRR